MPTVSTMKHPAIVAVATAVREMVRRFGAPVPILAALGPLICFFHVSRERVFYCWDWAVYHDMTCLAAAAFRSSWGEGIHYLAGTLGDDYNALFSIPLIPFVVLFGEQRAVFLSAVFIVYLLPLLLIVGALLRHLYPAAGGRAVWVGALVAFLSPPYWFTLLLGYPDTSGAILLAAAAWLHVARGAAAWRWRSSLLLGLALGASIVLRRHYAFGVIAFYLALGVDVALVPLIARIRGRAFDARGLLQRGLHLGLSGLGSLALVFVVTPGFVRRALTITHSHMHASWETTPGRTASIVLETVGALPLLLALIGGILTWRARPDSRPALRFLALLGVSWLGVWTFVVRQAAYHYPHVLPFLVSVGIGALVLALGAEDARPSIRRWGDRVIAALIVFVFVGSATQAPIAAWIPTWTLPQAFRPYRDPAYPRIAALIGYLREVAGPDATIAVAASSMNLNYDAFHAADVTLYGEEPWRLNIAKTPVADSMGELPTDALTTSDFIVVASPFQHHLAAESQKVVRVLADAFVDQWEIAGDYEALPREFDLPPDVKIRIWKRIRKTSPEVRRRTIARVSGYVLGVGERDQAQVWMKSSSTLPAETRLNPDGSSCLTGHPARGEIHQDTVFETVARATGATRISGVVQFYDPRCAGAELVASAGGHSTPLGVFHPSQGRPSFRSTVDATADEPVLLVVRSDPARPSDTDYCTLKIDELRVAPADAPPP